MDALGGMGVQVGDGCLPQAALPAELPPEAGS